MEHYGDCLNKPIISKKGITASRSTVVNNTNGSYSVEAVEFCELWFFHVWHNWATGTPTACFKRHLPNHTWSSINDFLEFIFNTLKTLGSFFTQNSPQSFYSISPECPNKTQLLRGQFIRLEQNGEVRRLLRICYSLEVDVKEKQNETRSKESGS